jgi:glycosyltransferase involved in cell wall biosynthesis
LTRPIRIAHVIESLGTGGAETLLVEVVSRLERHGFESTVVPLDAPLDLSSRLAASGVPVRPVLVPPRRRPLRCYLRLRAVLSSLRPDIVHTHLYYANVLGRLATRTAIASGLVTTLHNPDYTFESKSTWLFAARKWLDRVTGAGNEALLAVSMAVAHDYHAHMGWEGIEVIPNGVDLARFSPVGARAAPDTWPRGDVRVLSVGRLHPQKGHDLLIEAVDRCRSQGVAISLAIAGEGPMRGVLEAAIESMGLEDRVRLLGRRDDTPDLLRGADVFVMPSRYEAIGIALLEAMACGVAVVGADTGGIPEVIEADESGLLAQPGDVESLTRALLRLASDPDLRRRLGTKASERARHFDIERTVSRLEDVYGRVLDARRRQGTVPRP